MLFVKDPLPAPGWPEFSPKTQIARVILSVFIRPSKTNLNANRLGLHFPFVFPHETSVRARLERLGRSEICERRPAKSCRKAPKKENLSLRRRPARSCSQRARFWLAGKKGTVLIC